MVNAYSDIGRSDPPVWVEVSMQKPGCRPLEALYHSFYEDERMLFADFLMHPHQG
jgi:hypothetical protein